MNSIWKFLIIVLACIQEGLSIKCWVCRSDINSQCSDPFDNSTFELTECELSLPYSPNASKSVICRKILRKVNEHVTIIRSCAYLGKSDISGNKNCVTRVELSDVSTKYCSCNTDGCNTGTTLYSNQLFIPFTALLTYFMTHFYIK